MIRLIRLAAATAAVCALVPALAGAATVKRPSGTYTGDAGSLILSVTGRVIDLAALDFPCGKTSGRVSFNDIRIGRKKGRWRFSLIIYGSVTFADGAPDENGRFRFSGRFSPSGRLAVGRLSHRVRHCGDAGERAWIADR